MSDDSDSGVGDDPTEPKTDRPVMDTTRTWFMSSAMFAVAGVIWLVSGNALPIGLVFVALAVSMAAIGRAFSTRR